VFGLADKQEKEKNLCWYAIIPWGGQFVEKNHTMLDNSKIFADFLEVAEAKGEAKINLIQNDPKTIAEVCIPFLDLAWSYNSHLA
jgi:hypothetical protein